MRMWGWIVGVRSTKQSVIILLANESLYTNIIQRNGLFYKTNLNILLPNGLVYGIIRLRKQMCFIKFVFRQKGTLRMKKKYVLFVLFIVLFVAFWNLFDFLYATFITRSGYKFGVSDDLVWPLFLSCFSGFFMFLRKKTMTHASQV